MTHDGGGGAAPAPTHSEAPAHAHTPIHTETTSLLHSHDAAPPSYLHHQDDQYVEHGHHHHHNHHDHHHRHHHNHSSDGSPDLPTGALGAPPRWQQGQRSVLVVHGNPPVDRSYTSKFVQTISVVLFVAFGIYFFWSFNQARNAVPGDGPWRSSMFSGNSVNTVHNEDIGSIEDRVFAILSSTPLIDGHNDLAIWIRGYYQNDITSSKFRSGFEHDGLADNVDLPRLRAGQSGGAFWSAFVGCPANASYDMSNDNYASAVSATLEQIDLLRRLQAQYSRDFTPAVQTPLDPSGRERMILQWHAMRSLFGPISIEGLHQIPPSSPFSTLRLYHSLGVRMATLTWNCHNPFADASLVMNGNWTSPPAVVNGVFRPEEGAVTTRGKQVLREMNRLGMIIDISHTSYWTQKAVLSGTDDSGKSITRAPVVFSHSSAYALCPHPRNVRDDILDLVPKSKSLVMVNFSPGFISCTAPTEDQSSSSSVGKPHFSLPDSYAKNNTLHQVARHILYIGERIGYDHVGIGSDFDGMGDEHPRGLSGVDKYPDLVAELLKMGVSDGDAKKVVGGNLLRVWKDVDGVAGRMLEEGVEPGVDEVKWEYDE